MAGDRPKRPFSVWGVIYLLLAAFSIYGLVTAVKGDEEKAGFTGRIGVFFILSCLANIGWIFAWHYQVVPLSLVLMLVLLGCLITIYLRLNIGRSDATAAEKYLVHMPFSVYMGWITIATIANVTALLVDIGWNGFGLSDQFWTVAVIIVGIAITAAVLITRRDVYYSLVVVWAFLGILIKRMSDATVPDQAVVFAAVAGMALIAAGIITQLVRRTAY